MKVSIIGFKDNDFSLLEEKMEELISNSQFYLFYVLVNTIDSVGYKWAEKYGAPVQFIQDNSIDGIIKETDYLVIKYDGSREMHKLIFKFKETGKHGTVIQDKEYK